MSRRKRKIPQYVVVPKEREYTVQRNRKSRENGRRIIFPAFCCVLMFLIMVLFLPIKINTSIARMPYEGIPPSEDDMNITVRTVSGFTFEPKESWYRCDIETLKDVGMAKVSFLYLKDKYVFSMMPLSGVTAEYRHVVYPGDRYQRGNMEVSLHYYDKKTIPARWFDIIDCPERFGREPAFIKVKAEGYTAAAEVTPVQIVSAEAEYQENLHQYDEIDIKKIVVTYGNGKKKRIPGSGIKFASDKSKATEKLGDNHVEVEYRGIVYNIAVKTIENTNVSNAMRDYAEEIENADYTHISDTCIVAVKKHEDDLGTYFLSHVIINSPSQITGQLSNNDWGGDREKPSDAAERLGLVLATNASYFSYDTGNPSTVDIVIKDGKVYNDGETCGKEVCLMKDGSFYSPGEGLTAQDLLDMGAVTTWGAGDPLLIQDGKLLSTEHDWVNGKYPRTAVGMIKPCDYYVLTAGSGRYKGGLTFDDVQEIYSSLGCSYARTFDGGGSSTLVFNDDGEIKVINNPAGSSERPVADIFGISD